MLLPRHVLVLCYQEQVSRGDLLEEYLIRRTSLQELSAVRYRIVQRLQRKDDRLRDVLVERECH